MVLFLVISCPSASKSLLRSVQVVVCFVPRGELVFLSTVIVIFVIKSLFPFLEASGGLHNEMVNLKIWGRPSALLLSVSEG